MAFNRDRNSRPSGGFRPRFHNRGDRGPVEMHKAICDNCGKECEVPFRPTSGKPVYCSNCFGDKQNLRSQGDLKKNTGDKDELEKINAKLDNILKLLENKKTEKKAQLKETTLVKEE